MMNPNENKSCPNNPRGNEILWAPWRMAYIGKGDGDADDALRKENLTFLPDAEPKCFLCQAAASDGSSDKARQIIGRTERTIAVLNRYPYNNGHLLVAPKRHIGRLDQLTAIERAELLESVTDWVGRLERAMNAEGFNVGLNLGRVAGAGLPGHLHWHIIPRWNGDTNFITTIGSTKVIPQSMEELWNILVLPQDC